MIATRIHASTSCLLATLSLRIQASRTPEGRVCRQAKGALPSAAFHTRDAIRILIAPASATGGSGVNTCTSSVEREPSVPCAVLPSCTVGVLALWRTEPVVPSQEPVKSARCSPSLRHAAAMPLALTGKPRYSRPMYWTNGCVHPGSPTSTAVAFHFHRRSAIAFTGQPTSETPRILTADLARGSGLISDPRLLSSVTLEYLGNNNTALVQNPPPSTPIIYPIAPTAEEARVGWGGDPDRTSS